MTATWWRQLSGSIGEVLIHGIAISPGKPTIIGRSGTIALIGLPGHPASAFIVLIAIVRHLLTGMTAETGSSIRVCTATLGQNVPSSKGREDYVRVVRDGIATPVFGKSGLLNTLVRSTGVIRVPAESEGLETGTRVEVIVVVKRYLTVTSLSDTLALLRTGFACTPSRERVQLLRAVGRITAEPVFARYSVPEVHLAAMDGIAVHQRRRPKEQASSTRSPWNRQCG